MEFESDAEIRDLPINPTGTPISPGDTFLEIQRTDLPEGEESEKIDVETLSQLMTGGGSGASGEEIDQKINEIDHLAALDVPALLNLIRPTVETWGGTSGGSAGGGRRIGDIYPSFRSDVRTTIGHRLIRVFPDTVQD